MRILVVEDDEDLALEIKFALENDHYQTELAFDGDQGRELALVEEYDLVILDIMLPGISGVDILKEMRREEIITPVLFLTSKNKLEDRVTGLDAGADDYLTKPFATPELLARVRSLLRRMAETKSSILSVDDLELDTRTRQVTRNKQLLNLTAKEYGILELLMYNKNRILPRLSIAEHIWGNNLDLFNMTNFVDVHIKNLRKKIDGDRERKLIQTFRGIGYSIMEQT